MSRIVLTLVGVVLLATYAEARPTPGLPTRPYCSRCERGEAQLEEMPDADIGAIRRVLLVLTHPPDPTGTRVILDTDRAALARFVDAFGEEGLDNLAAMTCHSENTPCERDLSTLLACMRAPDCPVRWVDVPPEPEPEPEYGLPNHPGTCDPYSIQLKSPKLGVGAEITTGWTDSAQPNEHRAWGFGLEVRRRLSHAFGIVGRFDYARGRDAGIDTDGDGRDDQSTGTVARISALGGLSLLFKDAINNGVVRYLELDLLGGYTKMTSPADENGPLVGADLSYQLAVVRAGLRVTQGFGDAQDARAVLAHFGLLVGSAPSYSYGGGCPGVGREDGKSLPIGLALDIPVSGYGLGGLGYLPPGFGFEGAYQAHPRLQLLARGDLLVFPHGDADHVMHQALLAGLRIDLSPRHVRTGFRNGFFLAAEAGYSWGAVTRPSTADSGPVVDASLGYISQADDGGLLLRLHGRFGLADANRDLQAIFLSVGLELHLDRRAWRD